MRPAAVPEGSALQTSSVAAWSLAGIAMSLGVLLALTWRPAYPASRPAASAAGSILRGAALSEVGDCAVCHSAQHARPYAGGRPIRTPFGTIYSSNITPDRDTGIGAWSYAAFRRAMTRGLARNGAQLYPAFPYDHFTRLHEPDLRDIYAFLMTRTAVRSTPPANRLVPPLGFRPVVAGWKLLFFRPGPLAPDPALDALEARGRYLAEALGHCGACHSPRNVLGAEERDRAYDGGWSDGWWAPPLNARSPAVRAWTAERLYAYLRTGLDTDHAAAAGPMGAVTRELSRAPEADVRALSAYFARLMRDAPAARREPPLADREEVATREHPEGARLYAGACATCHERGAGMVSFGGRPLLPLGTPLHEGTPRDTAAIILDGLQPPVGRAGPYMPPFADAFTDAQVADIVAFLRARYGEGAPWPDAAREVARARKEQKGS